MTSRCKMDGLLQIQNFESWGFLHSHPFIAEWKILHAKLQLCVPFPAKLHYD